MIFSSPLHEVGKHQFCFVVHIVSEAPLKEINIKPLFVVESCSPKLEQTFSQGWATWTAAQAASHFLVFFFFVLGFLCVASDSTVHSLSASSPKCFRKEAPVLAKPDAQTEPKDPVVGLAPASRGGSCVRMGSAADANLFSKACPSPSLRIGG